MAKELVIYFSVYGTAKIVAQEIARQTGADIREIVPEVAYDGDQENYPALFKLSQKEYENNVRPKIKNELPIADYDRIYIGYPMWYKTFPMIMYTLFEQYDFAGKTIIPFNTYIASGDGGTYQTIRELAPKATVLTGLPVEMYDAEDGAADVVSKWLLALNEVLHETALTDFEGGDVH